MSLRSGIATARFMVLLLAAKPDEKAIRGQMTQLLTAPVVVKSANRFAKVVLTDRMVRQLTVKQLDNVAAEPELRKACDELFQNW